MRDDEIGQREMMRVFCALLLFVNLVRAEVFRLEVGYFDFEGGRLQVGDVPLSDGCLGQVIEDVGDDGIAPPRCGGAPGAGDALLEVDSSSVRGGVNWFRVNGERVLGEAGFFYADPGIYSDKIPQHPICIRIWNSADPALATGYWDSPLYTVLPGVQQVSFDFRELTYHSWVVSRRGDRRLDEPPAEAVQVAAESELFSAYPNPFNNSTTLVFHLSEAEPVQLRLFDIQGRLARTLAEGVHSAGTHRITFDGATLATGTYLASLTVGKRRPAIRRLVLLK